MHNLQRRLRRAAGLGAAAMLAVPLAAQAADYRIQLSESFNSGLAAARPAISLRALLDSGSGGAPVPTGVLRFNVDLGHLTSSAWASMLAAPAGTQLGSVTSDLTGASALRVLSPGKDATGSYVRAGIDVPCARPVASVQRSGSALSGSVLYDSFSGACSALSASRSMVGG